MPDLLDSIRGEQRARLDQLRPLVREYDDFKSPNERSAMGRR